MSLETDLDKADYLQRFCGASDFGLVPSWRMILALRSWREIADRYPIPSSPAYHALRMFFQWLEVPAEPYFPHALTQDEREGRTDLCENSF